MRTPLNGILGMTQLVLEGDVTDEQREFLSIVSSSGESLLTLVNDLLDHSKLEAGKLKIDAIAFDLPHTIQDVVASLDFTAEEKGLSLDYEIADTAPTQVVGDPGRVRRVLVNLVGNAIKFTPTGSVTVGVTVDSESEGSVRFLFRVTDTGIGLSQERAEAIFEPFEQATDSTASEFGGTGLGLSISRKLVELMGGEMWVESVEGEGSTFLFTIRLGLVEDTDIAQQPPADRSQVRAVVLTDTDRQSLADALVGTQFKMVRVKDADHASQALAEIRSDDHVHLIIVDFRDHGLQAAAAVLPLAEGSRLMILTPSGQRGDAARCRELGINAYLTGSLNAAELSAAIDAVISGAPGLITRHWLQERHIS
jgi:CheY-like chemotaxis protein